VLSNEPKMIIVRCP